MPNNNPIRLRLPAQDHTVFTQFTPDAEHAHRWAQELPITNTREVIGQLEEALGALNRLELKPDERFHILEALRPPIHVALSNLSRKLLNLPLVLPEESRQMLESSAALYRLSATAYTLVAVHAIQQRDSIHSVNPARLVCEALQRAVHFSGRMILQSLQLHQDVEANAWQNLHQLYALAERQQLVQLSVVDRLSGGGSIANTYLQIVMLGCCKPNQLLQNDLTAVHQAFRSWGEYLKLEDPDTGSGLFIVDLDSDQPPLYSALYPRDPGSQCRFIDSSALKSHLESLREAPDYNRKQGLELESDQRLSDQILQHLLDALSEASSRNFNRKSSSALLSITLGLSDSHFHLAGEEPFEQLLFGPEFYASVEKMGNPFLESQHEVDAWEAANPDEIRHGEDYDERGHGHAADVPIDERTRALLEDDSGESYQAMEEERHPVLECRSINASPGGYCLSLTGEAASRVRTGEILALREDGDADWSIAAVRWMNRSEDNAILFGVELISPMAEPIGARILNRKQPSDPLRALILPEIKLVGQTETLLVPKLGFREGQRVELMRHGETRNVRLLRQLPLTGHYLRFEIKYITDLAGRAKGMQGEISVDNAYESLWNRI